MTCDIHGSNSLIFWTLSMLKRNLLTKCAPGVLQAVN